MATETDMRITLRIPPALHDRVKATATVDRRSLNAEILALIEEALRARDQHQRKK